MCDVPVRYKGDAVRIANIVLTVVGSASGLVRLGFKYFYEGRLGWDDCALAVTLISCVPSAVMIDRGLIPSGLGRDVWTLPFDHITNFARWLFILESLYFVQVGLVKITLLLFFLRIFPRPLIRRLLWGTIVITGVWSAIYFIVTFCQCQPVSYFWTSWSHETPGKCFNINAMAWSQAAISIIIDAWMLGLPLYEILQLRLSWQKKVGVTIMFCVGTFYTVVSVLRLKTVVSFGRSTNPTWDETEIIHWSNIECNVGIICACLPTFRVMLATASPKFFGSSGSKKASSAGQVYCANNGKHGQNNMTIGGSHMMGPTSGKGAGASKRGLDSGIYRTQEFEIQHTDENDDAALVYMKEFATKKGEKTHSSASSIGDSVV